MLLDTIPGHFGKHMLLARMVEQINSPSAGALITGMIQADSPGVHRIRMFPSDVDGPAIYMYQGSHVWVILMGGAQTAKHADDLWTGYVRDMGWELQQPQNSYLIQLAETTKNLMTALNPPAPRMVYFAGHSTGGAALTVLASKIAEYGWSIRPEVVTFGAPRPGSGLNERLRVNCHLFRWMNDDDWVPAVPPRISYWSTAGLRLGTRVIRRLQNFQQPGGGAMLTVDGVKYEVDLPNRFLMPSTANLASAWFNGRNDIWTPHTMAEYIRRLQLLIDRQPQGGISGGGDDWGEQQRPVTPIQAERIQREMVRPLTDVGARQNDPPLRVPSEQLCTVFRVNTIYYVLFGGKTIATCTKKKQAYGLARLLNSFLRRLQRVAVCEPQALLEQLNAFLIAATTPGGGFSPVMNIQYPDVSP